MRSKVVSTAVPSFTLIESPPDWRAISGDPANTPGWPWPTITGPPGERRGPKITPPSPGIPPGIGDDIGPWRRPPPGYGDTVPGPDQGGANNTIRTASALSSAF